MSEVNSSNVDRTVINAQTVIKGEITFAGPATVCGRIEGQIRAQDELQITEEGSVEGDIIGAVVDIQGTVKGNVTASQTTRLGANAKLIGELRAANLAISEGATFVGKVCVGEAPAQVKTEIRAAASAPAGQLRMSRRRTRWIRRRRFSRGWPRCSRRATRKKSWTGKRPR